MSVAFRGKGLNVKDSWRRRSRWSSGDEGRKERDAETDDLLQR